MVVINRERCLSNQYSCCVVSKLISKDKYGPNYSRISQSSPDVIIMFYHRVIVTLDFLLSIEWFAYYPRLVEHSVLFLPTNCDQWLGNYVRGNLTSGGGGNQDDVKHRIIKIINKYFRIIPN